MKSFVRSLKERTHLTIINTDLTSKLILIITIVAKIV